MRDIQYCRALEAIQDSSVNDLLGAAIGPRNNCEVSFLTGMQNDEFLADLDLPARRLVKQNQMAFVKQCSHDKEDLLL